MKITKEQFFEYLMSDNYNEDLTAEECKQVFVVALKGSSDLTQELMDELVSEYSANVKITVEED